MMRTLFAAIGALFLLLAPAALAQTASLVPWVQGLEAAQAPMVDAMQSVRQIARSLNAPGTPSERGQALVATGPPLAAALTQIRRARAAVEAYPPLLSGDRDQDALALAVLVAVRTNVDSVERLILALQRMQAAGARGDTPAVQRAAVEMLPLPAIMLRGTAASFRLMALQLAEDDSQRSFYRARAAFYEAGALVVDVSQSMNQVEFAERIGEGLREVEAGRLLLAAERSLIASAPREFRPTIEGLLNTTEQGLAVTERALTTFRDDVASLGPDAAPELRLQSVRPAGEIERENQAISARAAELGRQMLEQQ